MRLSKAFIFTNVCFLLFAATSCLQPKDEYITLLEKEAKAGDGFAQNDLGYYYLENQNYEEAIKWFEKAAEKDLNNAYFNLGLCCLNGLGTGKDIEKAISYFSKSYEKGKSDAALLLGYIYLNKELDCFDPQKSIHWFEQAAKHNKPQADYIIGSLYLTGDVVEKNDTLAFQHIKQAAYQGDPNAQFHLGTFYSEGFMVPCDYNLSVNWIRKAAEQGLIDAQLALGNIYYYGIGVESDPETAQYWRDIAMEQKSIIENAGLLSQIKSTPTATKKPIEIAPLDKRNIKTEADSLYQKGFQVLFGNSTQHANGEAIDCLTKATLKGHKTARALLSYCFATGLGVHRSKVTAASLFVGKGQIRYSIGKEVYNIDFEIFEDGDYEKQMNIELLK